MNAVNIIALHDLFHQGEQVIRCAGHARVEIPLAVVSFAKFGMLANHRSFTHLLDMLLGAHREGDKPRMALHASLVTLLYGKGQWVISG